MCINIIVLYLLSYNTNEWISLMISYRHLCSCTFLWIFFTQSTFFLFIRSFVLLRVYIRSFCILWMVAWKRFAYCCDEAKKGEKKMYMKIKLYEREQCYWMKECWEHWMAWCWLSISCCVVCRLNACICVFQLIPTCVTPEIWRL